MSSEIFTGVVGLVGALVGGGVTMATSYLNARGQRQVARSEHDHQVMDAQRDACVTFLKQADLFLDHARALAGALEGTVTVPTLVIAGGADDSLPPSFSREIHSLIAGSRLVELPGVGHSSPVEDPDGVKGARAVPRPATDQRICVLTFRSHGNEIAGLIASGLLPADVGRQLSLRVISAPWPPRTVVAALVGEDRDREVER